MDFLLKSEKLILLAHLIPLVREAEKQSRDDTSCILVDLRKYPRQIN